jgi:hypothetical protein
MNYQEHTENMTIAIKEINNNHHVYMKAGKYCDAEAASDYTALFTGTVYECYQFAKKIDQSFEGPN